MESFESASYVFLWPRAVIDLAHFNTSVPLVLDGVRAERNTTLWVAAGEGSLCIVIYVVVFTPEHLLRLAVESRRSLARILF